MAYSQRLDVLLKCTAEMGSIVGQDTHRIGEVVDPGFIESFDCVFCARGKCESLGCAVSCSMINYTEDVIGYVFNLARSNVV